MIEKNNTKLATPLVIALLITVVSLGSFQNNLDMITPALGQKTISLLRPPITILLLCPIAVQVVWKFNLVGWSRTMEVRLYYNYESKRTKPPTHPKLHSA